MPHLLDPAFAVFSLTIALTFLASYLGRRHTGGKELPSLSQHRLNKWLVGLSAGATGNSGFVVTGAVGLGYAFGLQWLLLPFAWFLGDCIFWALFPARINRYGTAIGASTMTDLIVDDLKPRSRTGLRILIGLIILICLSGYVSAQWLAGQKFLQGAFDFGPVAALLAFATLIVVYTSLGGFRGSVYADTLQALVRVVGTAVALVAVSYAAAQAPDRFWQNLTLAGPDFLRLAPGSTPLLLIGTIAGFAAASVGFGLGQPQMVTRYLAGASPAETRSAWWIYILFLQSTWVAMTVFGVILRGVMPGLDDPETGLSVFHRARTGPLITGIIVADIFATIAATSNSLLVAMAQTVRFDLFRRGSGGNPRQRDLWGPAAVLGVATMAVSLMLDTTVVNLALTSVAMMGAGLAPAVMVRVMGWRHSDVSLALAIVVGILTAAAWRYLGFGALVNEAAPGMFMGLLANYVASRSARE